MDPTKKCFQVKISFRFNKLLSKIHKKYDHLNSPLMNLLKKNSFQWDDEVGNCFKALKQIMSTTPILSTPDFSKPFVIECDASGFEIVAMLMQ